MSVKRKARDADNLPQTAKRINTKKSVEASFKTKLLIHWEPKDVQDWISSLRRGRFKLLAEKLRKLDGSVILFITHKEFLENFDWTDKVDFAGISLLWVHIEQLQKALEYVYPMKCQFVEYTIGIMESNKNWWGAYTNLSDDISSWQITEVKTCSQFHEKGVMLGDKIIRINGRALEGLNEDEKNEMRNILTSGQRCAITFRRNRENTNEQPEEDEVVTETEGKDNPFQESQNPDEEEALKSNHDGNVVSTHSLNRDPSTTKLASSQPNFPPPKISTISPITSNMPATPSNTSDVKAVNKLEEFNNKCKKFLRNYTNRQNEGWIVMNELGIQSWSRIRPPGARKLKKFLQSDKDYEIKYNEYNTCFVRVKPKKKKAKPAN